MRRDIGNNEEIARRSAQAAGIAAAGESNPGAETGACRDIYIQNVRARNASFTAAFGAARQVSAGSAAVRARNRKLQTSFASTGCSGAPTRRARGVFAGCRQPRAAARIAWML